MGRVGVCGCPGRRRTTSFRVVVIRVAKLVSKVSVLLLSVRVAAAQPRPGAELPVPSEAPTSTATGDRQAPPEPAQPAQSPDREQPAVEPAPQEATDSAQAAQRAKAPAREASLQTTPEESSDAPEPAGTPAAASIPVPQDYADRNEHVVAPDQASGQQQPRALEPEDYYLFLPRAALFLPNLVLEVAFIPLRGLATVVDQNKLIERTEDLLYNDERTAGILPTAAYQSGYGLSFGARIFHSNLLRHGEELSAEARYGGLYQQAYKVSFEGLRVGGSPLWIDFDSRFEVKPALLFFGYGNASRTSGGQDLGPRDAAVGTRHREQRFMSSLTLGVTNGKVGDLSRIGVNFLFNDRQFGAEARQFAEPSIEQVYDTSQLVGFESGARILEVSPVFIYDSRDHEVLTSRGVYFNAFGGHTLPVSEQANYWHYGVTASTFIDLYERTRVLALRAVVEAVHGDDDEIPFSELIKLGGPDRLRGYRLDRFRDKTAAVATAEYRYPVHELVAGELFFDAGRVGRDYGEIFSGDGLKDLRYGGGLGFVLHDGTEPLFKIEGAYGEGLVVFFATDPLTAFTRRHKRL